MDDLYAGDGLTAMAFSPEGHLLAAEKRGRILFFAADGMGGFAAPQVFVDIQSQVDTTLEAGLLGLAIDPQFAASRRVYAFYTTPGDQRLVYFLANAQGDAAEPGSETVVLEGLPRAVSFHKAGDIEFQPGDLQHIYVALGDDGDGGLQEVDGISMVQHPDFYHGKLLKIDKTSGLGLSANPFFQGDPDSVRARVWAVGFRNPFRIAFHPDVPDPDVLYSSENGDATDRISWVRRGSNGAWSAAGDNGGFLDPPDNNHRVMTTIDPSQIGIAIASKGPFAVNGTPTLYAGNWFPSPFGIHRWQLSGSDQDTLSLVSGDNDSSFVPNFVAVDMLFGPDGALYFCETGGDTGKGDFFTLRRLRFVAGDPPVAAFATDPDPAQGNFPLTVQFSDQSAPGADRNLVGWLWDFGDGQSSTAQHPQHVFELPGVYTVQLTVTDNLGLTGSTQEEVTVLRQVDLALSAQVQDGRGMRRRVLPSATELAFYRADGFTPLAFEGGMGANGNRLAVPSGGSLVADLSLALTSNQLVISAGEPSFDGLQPAWMGFSVDPAETSAAVEAVFVLSDTMIRGQMRDARDAAVQVDVGTSLDSFGNYLELVGGRDHATQPTGINHRRDADALGYFHIPLPTQAGGSTFVLDLVGDTGTAEFAPHNRSFVVETGQTTVWNPVLGRYDGGLDCDDLDSIATTPNVDYATQIQPIWNNACTGCHTAAATNSGGLDLTGDSEINLVEIPAAQVEGILLVTPGDPSRSFLMEKINCGRPQSGTRMRPTDALPLEQQALVRDWIAQLDGDNCGPLDAQLPNWPSQSVLALVAIVSQSCR